MLADYNMSSQFLKNDRVNADISIFTMANVPAEYYQKEEMVPCTFVEAAKGGDCWLAWDLPEGCYLTDHSYVAELTNRLRACKSGVDKTDRTIEIRVSQQGVARK